MTHFFGKARLPVPIFNSPHFREIFGEEDGAVLLDHQGFFRPLEMVAFEGSIFEVVGVGIDYFEVKYRDYCSARSYFVCQEGVEVFEDCPTAEKSKKFDRYEIEQRMISQMGRPYLWGGNWPECLPYMVKAYPYLEQIGGFDGIDCSGLMYWASGGATPRNVSGLRNFGEAIAFDQWRPRPLDMLVWEDHIVFVLSNGNVIESREKFGVYQTPLVGRLRTLLKTRMPHLEWSDEMSKRGFVIRRGEFF